MVYGLSSQWILYREGNLLISSISSLNEWKKEFFLLLLFSSFLFCHRFVSFTACCSVPFFPVYLTHNEHEIYALIHKSKANSNFIVGVRCEREHVSGESRFLCSDEFRLSNCNFCSKPTQMNLSTI